MHVGFVFYQIKKFKNKQDMQVELEKQKNDIF
jgi:hypothetical protein